MGQYMLDTLQVRSVFHAARRLVPSLTRDEKKVSRLETTLQRLRRKNNEKFGGMQRYCNEYREQVKEAGSKLLHLRDKCTSVASTSHHFAIIEASSKKDVFKFREI